ncbi:MAG TPA: aromatic amino acid lyase [Acidimicrobiales bacterium]|nr:aromatic amino acid lyase [Acidimicrobiales bacterium]
MTVVLQSRDDFTLENFRRVAMGQESVEIGARALQAMAEARRSFTALVDSDRTAFIYGTTSGSGERARQPVPPGEQRQRALEASRRGRRGNSFGGGTLPDSVVRGIIFARLANYIEGNAKSRPVVAERIAEMLDQPLPKVPLAGQVGAGEVVPLAHVMSTFRGDDLELEEGEPMALVNGSPCSAALAADTALRAAHRLELAEHVFALSIEAFNAPLEAYDPALKALWRDRYECLALDRLAALLKGAPPEGRRAFQAPVSYRILPRVLGQTHRAVATLEEVAETALASVTDNPVYVMPDALHPHGRALSTGGYHNASAYPAIDGVSAAWADLCGIAERHTMKLHDASVSLLPHHLTTAADGWGGTAGLTMMQIGFGEEARHEAARTFLPASESGGFTGQNDVASPTFLSYAKQGRVAWCLDACLASLAVSCSQALFVTDRQAPPELRALLAAIRRRVPPVEDLGHRQLGAEVSRLTEALGEVASEGLHALLAS